MLWLLRMLRYLAMFLDGSKTSCRSPNSFSYLLGNFSHELRSRATGAKFRPLYEGGKRCKEGERGGSREAEINRLWWEEGRGKDRGRNEEAEEGRGERRKENSFSAYVHYIHPNQNPIQACA